ncbi:hypothetical protein GCM10025770_36710 [Viridibacterium curvum]|uniref:HupE/UreJ family protein n=2 Tax=Viridibacterium curvum TaxID=1101404 RepID=A0ABP9R590_9RHOO
MAHEPFEITTNVRLFAERISLQVVVTDTTAALLCVPAAKRMDAEVLRANEAEVKRCVSGLYAARSGDKQLMPVSVDVTLNPENDLVGNVDYPAAGREALHFSAVHLARLKDPTYGATFTATGAGVFYVQKLLRADDAEVSFLPAGDGAGKESSFSEFLALGIEHILTGYDHLLFLAALLIVCRQLRTALIIITAFTLAHSITLALAALDIVQLSGRLVEPVIAATIVFVGLENLWRARRSEQELRGRWVLTFVFGLMHGFGFAGALRESGLPPGGMELIAPLLAFNLGVETGQLAVAAVFLPLLFWLRRFAWFNQRVLMPASILVALAGLWWLLERTVL